MSYCTAKVSDLHYWNIFLLQLDWCILIIMTSDYYLQAYVHTHQHARRLPISLHLHNIQAQRFPGMMTQGPAIIILLLVTALLTLTGRSH